MRLLCMQLCGAASSFALAFSLAAQIYILLATLYDCNRQLITQPQTNGFWTRLKEIAFQKIDKKIKRVDHTVFL